MRHRLPYIAGNGTKCTKTFYRKSLSGYIVVTFCPNARIRKRQRHSRCKTGRTLATARTVERRLQGSAAWKPAYIRTATSFGGNHVITCSRI